MRSCGLGLVVCLALAPSCVSSRAVRVSTLQVIPRTDSSLQLAAPLPDVVAVLMRSMAERGFPVVQEVAGDSGKYYIFKGARTNVTTVRGTSTVIAGSTVQVGSWYAARVSSAGGGTLVFLFGKPTLNGTEVCSDADAELKDAQYWCQDSTVRDDWPGSSVITGREESEVVRGVLIALKQQFKAS